MRKILSFLLPAFLLLVGVPARGADSGLTPSDGVFIIDFYDSSTLSSTSGTGLSNSNYSAFVKVATGLTKTNVVTSVSVTGTVQYGKNGGLTAGTGTAAGANSHYVTFNIGASYAVTKCTVYATEYESGRWLLNGDAAGSGSLGNKGATFSNVSSPLVWNNLGGVTALTFKKDNGSSGNQKRLTLYTIVCEYSTETKPSIDATDVILAYDDEEGTISYTINNPVEGGVLTATNTPSVDWLDLDDPDGSDVYFVTNSNTGNKRTATVRLTYTYNTDKTVTKDVTITQVKSPIATLPSVFNSGKAEIANAAGYSQSGIDDNDYSTDNTKLKFNNQNDYLILRFDGVPGKLSFNMKGNPSSGDNCEGTFKVQTSTDGETYTDLEQYINPSKTESSQVFNNIAANVRYIKWIYSARTSGNVGIGNICLSNKVEISLSEYEWGTFVAGAPLDFTGSEVKAYIVTNHNGATLTKTQITGTVPANTPLLVNAEEGVYEVPVTSSGSADVSENKLHPGTGAAVDAGTGVSRFVLSESGGKAVFQKIVGTNATVPIGKAYLEFDGSAPAPSIIRIVDEENNATNIEKVQAVEEGVKFIQNGKLFIKKNGVVYDMLGTIVR